MPQHPKSGGVCHPPSLPVMPFSTAEEASNIRHCSGLPASRRGPCCACRHARKDASSRGRAAECSATLRRKRAAPESVRPLQRSDSAGAAARRRSRTSAFDQASAAALAAASLLVRRAMAPWAEAAAHRRARRRCAGVRQGLAGLASDCAWSTPHARDAHRGGILPSHSELSHRYHAVMDCIHWQRTQ